MRAAILLNSLMISFLARADDAPCRREGDRVSCAADGFKKLTDLVVEHRARADKCELRLVDALADTKDVEVELHACQAAMAAVKPCPPLKSPIRPLLGVAAAVAGTVLLSAGLVADVPSSVRLPLAGVGLAGIGGAIVLVWP